MGWTIADQLVIYNEILAPGVMSLIQSQSKLLDRFKKSWDTIDHHGKYARQRIAMSGSQAFGAKSNATYPTGQESSSTEALIRVKRWEMLSMAFDGLSLELAEKGGAPVDPQDFEQEELFKGLADDMSRQLMGDGSGIIAFSTGGGTTATLPIDHPLYASPGTLFFNVGRVLDSHAITTHTQEINSTAVLTVDSGSQLTLAASQTFTDNTEIHSEDSYAATEAVGTGEIMGVTGIVRETDPPYPNASAGLQGILVSSYPLWKAKLYANGGTDRAFDQNLITKALQERERYGKITVLLCTEAITRIWNKYLETYKTMGATPKAMWGGWVAAPFYYNGREIPLVSDLYVPDGEIMGLADDEFTIHLVNKSWITWEKVGGEILQKVAGQNSYVSEGHIFGNLGVRNRRPHFRIQDIDETGV